MNLVYYTIGFDVKYLDLLYLSILSLRKHNSTDIMVICDKSLVDQCREKLKNFSSINIVPCGDSTGAMNSSMKKLRIFDYDVSKYSKVLFVDSDILIDIDLTTIFSKINDDKLHAPIEHRELGYHYEKWHSLNTYTKEDVDFLVKNIIYPFCAGMFGFVNSITMKEHFSNIHVMIENHTGYFYYEQSFMNVYFNLRNLVNRDTINDSNYAMGDKVPSNIPISIWNKNKFRNKMFHFSDPRGADSKLKEMLRWYNKFLR